MATKKDNQPARVELPEKEWFSLEEIAERWGCSVEHLLHLASKDLLHMGFIADQIEVVTTDVRENDRGLPYSIPPTFLDNPPSKRYKDDAGEELCYSLYHGYTELLDGYVFEGILAKEYTIESMVRLGSHLENNFIALIATYPGNLNERGETRSRYRYACDFSPDGASYHQDKPLPKICGIEIQRSDLVVALKERDRFEREYRIGAHAGTMPSKAEMEDRLDPRKEKTYLQIIRVLVKAAELPGEPFKAANVLQAMAAQHGLSLPSKADTIAEKIKAAITLED